MLYQVKDYSCLLGMEGFSDELLKNHFTLYSGYVNNTNKIAASLERKLTEGNVETIECAQLKRRLGWEADGMRLHELYFENLGGKGTIGSGSTLVERLKENFGSYEAWEKDFKATATIRGVGWAILYQDNTNGSLNNFWIDEHHMGHPVDRSPLVVFDAWEHSYMLDYGLKRADYMESFFKNIDWDVVCQRVTA